MSRDGLFRCGATAHGDHVVNESMSTTSTMRYEVSKVAEIEDDWAVARILDEEELVVATDAPEGETVTPSKKTPKKPKTVPQAMAGATAEYKARLRQVVDERTCAEVTTVATTILSHLPPADVGTLREGLRLAATAYMEFGTAAVEVLERETRAARTKGGGLQ